MLYLPYEIWRDVPWYEWLYKVSNMWNIIWLKNRKLSNHPNILWYVYWTLCNWDSHKQFRAHRLVAMCYISNVYWKQTINHINWIKNDNRVSNLERATNSEQQIHSIVFLWKKNQAAVAAMRASTIKKIDQLSKEWIYIKSRDSLADACAFLWIKSSCISRAIRVSNRSAWWYRRRYTI